MTPWRQELSNEAGFGEKVTSSVRFVPDRHVISVCADRMTGSDEYKVRSAARYQMQTSEATTVFATVSM